MGGSVNGIRAWLSELRRRGVFHVTGLYAVGAWAVVQIVDAISGPFPLPETALRLIWFAALLGFPVALVFGWRYDVTKHGIVRTHRRISHGEDVPINRSDYGVIGGLALVMVGIVAMTTVGVMDAIQEAQLRAALGPEVIEPRENSIAVLPFVVCDGDEADEALAEGLASEVINRLASQHLLQVIARTSSFKIASFNMPLLEMGQRLGVTHLLSGTLCREGGALVVSVELVDEKGFVVWSETLRQEVSQSGQVGTTLASLVVEGVAGALGHKITLARLMPVDPKAYEHFLIGQKFEDSGDEERARSEYEKALEIQPDYPEAVMALGGVAAEGDTTTEWLEDNRAYLERAMAMARQRVDAGASDFQAHLTLGKALYYLGRTDQELAWRKALELGQEDVIELRSDARALLQEAEQHFRKALAINPSHIETYERMADAIEYQGLERGEEALELLKSGLSLDPINQDFSRMVATRLVARGRYREGMDMMERFEHLPGEPNYWSMLERMNNYGAWADQFEKLVYLLREEPELMATNGIQGYIWWMPVKLQGLGLTEEAAFWYEKAQQLPALVPISKYFRRWFPAHYLIAVGRTDEAIELLVPGDPSDEEILGEWYWEAGNQIGGIELSGDYERAVRLQEALRDAQGIVNWEERRAWANMGLASLYLRVGREDDAKRELEAAARVGQAQFDAGIRHPEALMTLAHAYCALGEDAKALEMAEKHVEYGGFGPADLLEPPQFDPGPLWDAWQRFRDDPRFLAIVDRAQANRAQQAQRIRAITARNDIGGLLDNVITLAKENVAEDEAEAEDST